MHCQNALPIKNVFPVYNHNQPTCSFSPLDLALLSGTTLPSSTQQALSYLQSTVMPLLSLLFSRLTTPRASNLSSQHLFLRHLTLDDSCPGKAAMNGLLGGGGRVAVKG